MLRKIINDFRWEWFLNINFVSVGSDDQSSIKVFGQDLSYNWNGLNIVAYSIVRDRIVYCVSFDTTDSERTAFRN